MIIKFKSKELLREGQHEIFHHPARFKVCAMGRRWGKSILATYIILTKALQTKGNYFFVAPTFQQARQIIWEVLKDKTRNNLAKKVNESRLEIELINGSIIFLKGGDRADTLRGVSLSGVVMDEFATVRNNKDVWQEVIRPALSDKQGWALFISSPKGRDYFYDLYNQAKIQDNWKSWQKTTLDGGNVSESEIISAMAEMDERSFKQEYLADFVSYDGLVVPNYDRELNASYEVIKEDDTLIFGIDFNVNKMPCTVNVLRGDTLHCVDFFFGSFNTSELMEAIQLRYPKHRKIFHTDASGTANKSSAGGATDITIIRNYGYQVMNLARNPNIIDRVNAFNSMIKATSGVRKFYVSTKLKKVVETLEKHFFDENGLPNKKHEYHDDIFDACFSGDTIVLVNNKQMMFKDIPKEGLIQGHDGKIVKYINGGYIRHDVLCSIKKQDGIIIKATKDHKFLTTDGWIEAKNLEGKILWNTELYQMYVKSLEDKNIQSEQTNIFIKHFQKKTLLLKEKLEKAYTELFGNFIMAKYKMDLLYIIKMKIGQIIQSKIYYLWKKESTYLCTPKSGIEKIQMLLKYRLKKTKINVENGINQKTEMSGIKNILKICNIYSLKKIHLFAQYAVLSMSQMFMKEKAGTPIAQINAVQKREEIAELITKKENAIHVEKFLQSTNIQKLLIAQKVVQVKQECKKEKTYCVTIPKLGCFSLDNGIIVQNCSYAVYHYSDYSKHQMVRMNMSGH